MPETEQQDATLSELIVKEAVNRGMESPMRETILEAVEESEGARSGGQFPLAGALFGIGAAVGFLLGRQSSMLEETPLEDVEEPEIIESVRETTEETEETTVEVTDESDSPSRLSRLLLAVGLLAGAAILRRRLTSDEEEEWEPIEEFEPATDIESEPETATESEVGAEEPDEESEE
ncbi:hypothetical protein [Natrinema hispanicum]|nr:hypothetical protein [Natrinema hispanicum]